MLVLDKSPQPTATWKRGTWTAGSGEVMKDFARLLDVQVNRVQSSGIHKVTSIFSVCQQILLVHRPNMIEMWRACWPSPTSEKIKTPSIVLQQHLRLSTVSRLLLCSPTLLFEHHFDSWHVGEPLMQSTNPIHGTPSYEIIPRLFVEPSLPIELPTEVKDVVVMVETNLFDEVKKEARKCRMDGSEDDQVYVCVYIGLRDDERESRPEAESWNGNRGRSCPARGRSIVHGVRLVDSRVSRPRRRA
nr:hypothetical protein CFP56_64732 [Quercus suber]